MGIVLSGKFHSLSRVKIQMQISIQDTLPEKFCPHGVPQRKLQKASGFSN